MIAETKVYRLNPSSSIAPLPDEEHRCAECGVDYARLGVDEARRLIGQLPARVADVCGSVTDDEMRTRPASQTWSALEYLCHVRDVFATSTIRLHRVRTEDAPVLEPMLNDLRARRFRYNTLDPAAMRVELAGTVAGCLDEIDRIGPDGWERTATRLPGERRTARWLVRHAAHEAVHHLADLVRGLASTGDQTSAR